MLPSIVRRRLSPELGALIWYDMIYIFNRNWVDTWWQHYITHLHTNSTQNTQKGEFGKCGPCHVFASYTLAFALQLREKHGKPSVRVAQYKNNEQVQYKNNEQVQYKNNEQAQYKNNEQAQYKNNEQAQYKNSEQAQYKNNEQAQYNNNELQYTAEKQ